MFVFYFVTILLEDSNYSVNDASFLEQHYLQIILRNMGFGRVGYDFQYKQTVRRRRRVFFYDIWSLRYLAMPKHLNLFSPMTFWSFSSQIAHCLFFGSCNLFSLM